MRLLATILAVAISALTASAWDACSVWAYLVPTSGNTMRIPDSHDRTSVVAFLTSTNYRGNLTGATISATVEISTANNPIFEFGNDCGSGIRFPNFRLYFTTVPGAYDLNYANAHELEYWWSQAVYAEVKAGTVTLTASLDDPSVWTDSQGHKDTNGFNSAVSRIAQAGFSFGGGCFYDVGIGIYNPNTPESTATFTVRDFSVVRPFRLVIQYSDDLATWSDLQTITDPMSQPMRFYRLVTQ